MEGCTNKQIGEWIALYEMGGLEDDTQVAFLDHLLECEYCYTQVYSLEPVMTAFRSHRTAAQHARASQPFAAIDQFLPAPKPRRFWNLVWRPVPLAAAFSLLIAVAVGALYLSLHNRQTPVVDVAQSSNPGDAGNFPWQSIEVPKPVYTPPGEQVVLRNPTAKAFARAMAAYQENDFASAIEQLKISNELEPGSPEVNFYLGTALLLIGESKDAIPPLRQAVELSTGARLESSLYYLALAYLKNNQPPQALAELEAVIRMTGQHQAAAEKLKQQVSDSTK